MCPYCGTPSVVERPATRERPVPTFAVGFVIPEDDACTRVKHWLWRAGLLARSDFKRAAVGATRGVYLPAYLYGAVATSDYRADIGEHYWETRVTKVNGKTTVRRVRRTEWRQLTGRHACYVRDVIVTASGGLPNPELEATEPFDLGALKRYDHAIVSGWIAEEPSLRPDECRELARTEAKQGVLARLSDFMPGDEHARLEADVHIDNEVLDLLLLPLWVFAVKYRADAPPVRVVVNGQSGKVAGKVPLSWVKISLLVILCLALVTAVVLLYMAGGPA